jgi:hypothetical protein
VGSYKSCQWLKMKLPSEFTGSYRTLLWRCCGRKYCVSLGEKIKGRWWKFRADRHVAATHDLKHAKNWQIYSGESINFSHSHSREDKTMVSLVLVRLLQVWVTKKCVLNGCCVSLWPTWREQDCKHMKDDYSPATKARVLIFCTALLQVIRIWCITMTWKWKTSHLNIVTLYFTQKRKKYMTQPPAEKCMLTILWD